MTCNLVLQGSGAAISGSSVTVVKNVATDLTWGGSTFDPDGIITINGSLHPQINVAGLYTISGDISFSAFANNGKWWAIRVETKASEASVGFQAGDVVWHNQAPAYQGGASPDFGWSLTNWMDVGSVVIVTVAHDETTSQSFVPNITFQRWGLLKS